MENHSHPSAEKFTPGNNASCRGDSTGPIVYSKPALAGKENSIEKIHDPSRFKILKEVKSLLNELVHRKAKNLSFPR